MNKLLKISFLFLIIVVNSCNKFGTDFVIRNGIEKTIDSIAISNGFNKITIEELKKDEKRKGFIDFKINKPKNDGAYFVQVFDKNKTIYRQPFGYYSNGIPSGSTYHIEIYKDTLIIREHFD